MSSYQLYEKSVNYWKLENRQHLLNIALDANIKYIDEQEAVNKAKPKEKVSLTYYIDEPTERAANLANTAPNTITADNVGSLVSSQSEYNDLIIKLNAGRIYGAKRTLICHAAQEGIKQAEQEQEAARLRKFKGQ